MKKTLMLLSFVLLIALAFTACKPKEVIDEQTPPPTESENVVTPPPITDAGYPREGEEGVDYPWNPGPDFASNHSDIVVCIGPDTESIDPGVNASVDGCTMIQHAFEGLYRLDLNGFPAPAQAFRYDISDDQTKYTFYLRDDIYWTDGEPVTAQQFEYAIKRNADPATGGHYDYMMDIIKGYDEFVEDVSTDALCVRALDDLTIEFELNAPCAYFLELLAFPTYMPLREDIINQYSDAWATKPETYISNGAFKLVDWTPGSHIRFAKNDKYWEANTIGPNSIEFKLIEDDNAALAAFESGELNYVFNRVPTNEVPRLSKTPEFKIGKQLGTYYIDINNSIQDYANATDAVKEFLSNPLVRKALCLAIDREYIVEKVSQGGQIPASNFIGPGFNDAAPGQSFFDNSTKYYDPYDHEGNVELAKAALAEAGYPNGEGAPAFEYLHNPSVAHAGIAEAMQHDWAQIGLTCNISVQDWAIVLATRPAGQYEVARDGWIADYNDPMTMLDMFVTYSGNNNARYMNPEYDKLIKAAKLEPDRAKYMQLLHEAEDMLMGDWAILPLYHYTTMILQDTNFKDVTNLDIGYLFFNYAYLD